MGFQHGYARAACGAFVGGGCACDACADNKHMGRGLCFQPCALRCGIPIYTQIGDLDKGARLPLRRLLPCFERLGGLLGDGRGVPDDVFRLREVFVQMAGGVRWQQPKVGFRLPLADVVHGIVHKAARGFLPCLGKGVLWLVFRLPWWDNVVIGQAEDKMLAIGMLGEMGLDVGKAGDVCPCVDAGHGWGKWKMACLQRGGRVNNLKPLQNLKHNKK